MDNKLNIRFLILYFYWFFHRNGKTFKEYLDSPIKWTYELPNEIEAYYDMDAGEELEELLEEQIRYEYHYVPERDGNWDEFMLKKITELSEKYWKENEKWVVYPEPTLTMEDFENYWENKKF